MTDSPTSNTVLVERLLAEPLMASDSDKPFREIWESDIQEIVAALASLPPVGITEEMVERAWLVEDSCGGFIHWVALATDSWPRIKSVRIGKRGDGEMEKYLSPVRFVKDANEALRFARKEDAEAFIALFWRFLLNPTATELEWPSACLTSALGGGDGDEG